MMVRTKNLSTPYIILQNERGDREYTIGQTWTKINDNDIEYFKRCYTAVLEFKDDEGIIEKAEKVIETVSHTKKKR